MDKKNLDRANLLNESLEIFEKWKKIFNPDDGRLLGIAIDMSFGNTFSIRLIGGDPIRNMTGIDEKHVEDFEEAFGILINQFFDQEIKSLNKQIDVNNLVCPTHGTKLYKHPNGIAYCSLCNYRS